jgi:chemotaxis protein MotB
MKIRIVYIAMLATLAACVPQRKFQDLQKNYDEVSKKQKDCETNLADLKDQQDQLQKDFSESKETVQHLSDDTTNMGVANRKLNMLYQQINEANEKLLDKQRDLESQNRLKNQELTAEMQELQRKLDERDVQLTNKELSLQKQSEEQEKTNMQLKNLQEELEAREKALQYSDQRVKELSQVLNQKDSAARALRNSISNALFNFKDQGIDVNIKNGKVYVSVSEKLLFQSGKYAVNSNGRNALLELAKVLNTQQQDVDIMVEGHTDNVPLVSSGTIKDNWDLSVMRATEVARILMKDGKVAGTRITAAGRGDTQPVASNDNPEGRAKNRRTEIILTPKLTELYKILEGQQ